VSRVGGWGWSESINTHQKYSWRGPKSPHLSLSLHRLVKVERSRPLLEDLGSLFLWMVRPSLWLVDFFGALFAVIDLLIGPLQPSNGPSLSEVSSVSTWELSGVWLPQMPSRPVEAHGLASDVCGRGMLSVASSLPHLPLPFSPHTWRTLFRTAGANISVLVAVA
jgi:hypothetical protein